MTPPSKSNTRLPVVTIMSKNTKAKQMKMKIEVGSFIIAKERETEKTT